MIGRLECQSKCLPLMTWIAAMNPLIRLSWVLFITRQNSRVLTDRFIRCGNHAGRPSSFRGVKHVTAALGGHESTGDMIFITPNDQIREGGRRAKELRKKVEREAKHIAPLINRHVFSLARQAIAYGDSYARIYTDERKACLI